MKSILKKLIQQTGVSIVELRPNVPECEEYLLTYNRTRRLCLSLSDNHKKGYYESAAWSCDCTCFLTFDDGNAILHSYLIKEPETYPIDIVSDNFGSFLKYITRYSADSNQSVVTYLFQQISVMHPMVDGENIANYLIAYSKLWGCDVQGLPKKLEDYQNQILEGININGNIIVPDRELLARFVAPTILDALSYIYTKPENAERLLAQSNNTGANFLDSFRLPVYMMRNIIRRSLSLDKDKDVFKIFQPFILSSIPLVETIIEIRRKGFEGRIEVWGYSLLETTSEYYEQPLKILDNNLELHIEAGMGLVLPWPNECDMILAYPSYRVMGEYLQSVKDMEGAINVIGFESIDDITFKTLRKSYDSLKPTGQLFMIAPTYVLNESDYKETREEFADKYAFLRVELLGDYALRNSGSMTSIICCRRDGEIPQRVMIRWCNESPSGYDKAERNENKKNRGGITDDTEISPYPVMQDLFTPINWAPRAYSENIVILETQKQESKDLLKPINELFTISSGVRTGNNDLYVLPVESYDRLPEIERIYFKLAISGKTIHDGKLDRSNMIFFPYTEDGGMITSETQFKKLLPTYSQILLNNRSWLARRNNNGREYKIWDLVYWKKIHIPGKPKIVTSYYGAQGSIALDINGEYVVSAGYQWMPRKSQLNTVEMFLAYFAVLSSVFFWKIVDAYAERTYSTLNFKYKLTNTSIGMVPIPDLSHPRYSAIIHHLTYLGSKQFEAEKIFISPELEELVTLIYQGDF